MSLQNPTIPIPTNPVEIDRAILDLQAKLLANLPWLSHGYARAYIQREDTQKVKFLFPSVYLGVGNKYLNIAPDNDKKAQSFFLVTKETVLEYAVGQHNLLSYDVSIIFTANLELVNKPLLATEIFQANLIKDVRQVITRDLIPAVYSVEISDIDLTFRDSYKEFQLSPETVLEKAPFTHFRVNCTFVLQEECP